MTDETNILPTDTDDTEGHMPFQRKIEDAGENDTVDTEGHLVASKRLEEAGENDTMDTEGHATRPGR